MKRGETRNPDEETEVESQRTAGAIFTKTCQPTHPWRTRLMSGPPFTVGNSHVGLPSVALIFLWLYLILTGDRTPT